MKARSIPGFEPAGAVTGIGSLPVLEPAAAVSFVAEHAPEVPFWPQLPQRHPAEGTVEQGLVSVDDLLQPRPEFGYDVHPRRLGELRDRLWRGPAGLDERCAAGLFAFERAVAAGAFPKAAALKGHLAGPITLAWSLSVNGAPAFHAPGLFAALTRHTARRAGWQARRLGRFGLPVLIFVDEPALCLADPDRAGHLLEALDDVLDAIRGAGALAGLHCCAGRSLPLMARTRADVFSFDAHAPAGAGPPPADELWGGADSRRIVAFGLVPTQGQADYTAVELFAGWLGAAACAGDLPALARRSMVTASCGLGLVDTAAAQASFSLAAGVAGLVRRVAGVPAVGAMLRPSPSLPDTRATTKGDRRARPRP